MSANELGQETSPYLLQHQDNPVHWLPWHERAFARARAENRPILLSIGYAACHWCHVMAHESFEDPETAAVMNDLFINIKVDREERPDIDQIYQAALAALGQPGGWPLTMFLTPDGQPFWGGTYFPPTARYGRPGFRDILTGVANAYRDQPDNIRQNVEVLDTALARLSENKEGQIPDPVVINRIAERLLREVDPVHGGIGGAPKFPQTPLFKLLWRAALRTGRQPPKDAVLNTLTHMCQGGIYDHLGGGFARYSTDERWMAPHFEKMLYDNAQLIELLAQVWQETRHPLFEQRIRETIDWLLREMTAPSGGFAATLDADSEGEEGRFYVWSETEIDHLLGAGSADFKDVYDVTRHGNWEETNILNRLHTLEFGSADAEAALTAQRQKLFAARAGRERPGWDDKVLADWNGLMIAALCEAAMVFDEPAWLTAAEDAFSFVTTTMIRDGRLYHAWRSGVLKHLASLDDLAAMIRAGLFLYEATGNPAYLKIAEALTATADVHHWDSTAGGYYFTPGDVAATDGTPLICRTKSVSDNATPSGNGMMVDNLARLALFTGNDAYGDRGEALVAAFAGELGRNFFPLPTFLNGIETLMAPVQVVIVGAPEQPATDVLRRAAYHVCVPDRILLRVAPGQALPPHHPAHGKTMRDGQPTAYVCRGPVCSAPVTTVSELVALLTPKGTDAP